VPIFRAAAWNRAGCTFALKCLDFAPDSKPMPSAIRSAAVPLAGAPSTIGARGARAPGADLAFLPIKTKPSRLRCYSVMGTVTRLMKACQTGPQGRQRMALT
jgi:hypothetical protein